MNKLFEKVILNNKVEVPNRLAVAPLSLFSSNSEGAITDEQREYLKYRAKRYRSIYPRSNY